MKSDSQKQTFKILTYENNSLQEILKWSFCFFRITGEKLADEFGNHIKTGTADCGNNTIFGYFKFC
jgi:hypothetical protein